MQKKLSIAFIFIFILMCLFCVSCYASTDYSVYDESSSQYHIVIPEKLKEQLCLPSADVPYYSGNQDLYYIIYKTSTGRHYFLISTVKFIEVSSDDENFNGTYSIKNSNNQRPNCFFMNSGSNEWSNGGYYDTNYYNTTDLSTIVFSSDDICNNVSGNIIIPKTVIKEDNGESGGNGDSGSTEDGGNTDDSGNLEEVKPQYYRFNGWDSIEYKLSALPDALLNYKHFIIVKDTNNILHLFGFNNSLSITYNSDFMVLNGDDNTTLKLFKYTNDNWVEYGEQHSYSLPLGSEIINSCIDLLQYSEQFTSGEDFFYQPPQIVTLGTLSPMVRKLEMKGVLMEIIVILPIIIMILVGLVGLKKVLKTLFQALRHS